MIIIGTNRRDTKVGTPDHDEFQGLGGGDFLFGEGGDDEFTGGFGPDLLNGGPGIDTARYDDSPVGVFVSLVDGSGANGTASGDTLFDIENVQGSFHNDILIGNDVANVLAGLSGDDSLFGGANDDQLFGGDDNDFLDGGQGADFLSGGRGIDTANYDNSPEGVFVNLEEGTGSDGWAEGDTLVDIENLIGSLHDDLLAGDNQPNRIEGLGGRDLIFGLDGVDHLYGNRGDDFLNGGRGADHLFGGRGNDILEGGPGADHLDGGPGNDTASYVGSDVGVQVNLEVRRGLTGQARGWKTSLVRTSRTSSSATVRQMLSRAAGVTISWLAVPATTPYSAARNQEKVT